jgi:hypothetical protein
MADLKPVKVGKDILFLASSMIYACGETVNYFCIIKFGKA